MLCAVATFNPTAKKEITIANFDWEALKNLN